MWKKTPPENELHSNAIRFPSKGRCLVRVEWAVREDLVSCLNFCRVRCWRRCTPTAETLSEHSSFQGGVAIGGVTEVREAGSLLSRARWMGLIIGQHWKWLEIVIFWFCLLSLFFLPLMFLLLCLLLLLLFFGHLLIRNPTELI